MTETALLRASAWSLSH